MYIYIYIERERYRHRYRYIERERMGCAGGAASEAEGDSIERLRAVPHRTPPKSPKTIPQSLGRFT